MFRPREYDQLAYTVKQTAALLGLRQEAVRHQIRAGNIRAGRCGQRYLISKEEILRLTGRRGVVTA